MRNLALRLTDISTATPALAVPAPAAQTPAETAPEVPAAEPAPPLPAAAPVSESPWIEEKLCTTCDECTTINKKIFAYNGNKKAYILDPKGGPYRDIVRSAEKCSSGAIHPGMPLDPNEKDLDKLIKRAERFQ
jgi:pyruvate-ferredoxin/flavodoxin oxidoreductase